MKRLLLTLAFLAVTLHAAPLPDPLYQTHADHDRDGIGKFFMGREIARVMGHQAWQWLERPEREDEERTDLLLSALSIKPGDAVADIGAGSGYFTWRMAKLAGEKGRIFAVEIQQEMLDLLMQNMAKHRVEKTVSPVLGTVSDPKLPAGSCNLMLMVDVYHEFDFPYEMIDRMIAALAPGGRIVFVEFRKEDASVPIKALHKMTQEQVKTEMSLHPALEFVETLKTLPRQHIIIFRKK